MSDRTYLDHAATTAMLPEVRQAWLAATAEAGNPSSLHASGRSARRLVEQARESIAEDLHCRPSDVIFTSGGTESDNTAIKGITWAQRRSRGARTILASTIEHHAVLDPLEWLVDNDEAEVGWLPVDALGRVEVAEVAARLDAGTALVTVMWANNEIGTVQPVAAIAEVCRSAGVPFHTDAVQALGQLPVDFAACGAAAMTVSSHKIGGPFGVGALIIDAAHPAFARLSEPIVPLLHGGGQERDIRSGTLDAPGISAFAVAVRHAVHEQQAHAAMLGSLRDALIAGVRQAVPDAVLNGDPVDRLPANAHFTFPGCQGDALLMLLDAAGIDCSTGSACTAGIPEPSHVLLALGADESTARESLRFSVGHGNSQADVDRLVAVLPAAVERARRARAPRRVSS